MAGLQVRAEGVRHLLRSSAGKDMAALYVGQFANYLLPLLILPYVARVLGPAKWGELAVTQSFCQYLWLVMEYGFGLSATRDVAQNRGDRGALARLLADVVGGKVLLAVAGATVTASVGYGLLDRVFSDKRMLWAGYFWAVSLALSPAWYYQGRERLALVAFMELVAKTAAVASIFFLVDGPADGWLVLGVQGAASVLVGGWALGSAFREVGVSFPSWSSVVCVLRRSSPIFLSRAATTLYTAGNPFILGIFAPSEQVAYFAGAERVVKALVTFVTEPFSRTFMPRLASAAVHTWAHTVEVARRVTLLMGVLGVLLAVALGLGAPAVVGVLLGPEFGGAVPVIRVLAPLVFLIAISNALGVQWMLALRMDRAFTKIVLGAGVVNIASALALAPALGPIGMGVAVLLAETFVSGVMVVYLSARKLSPWHSGGSVEG